MNENTQNHSAVTRRPVLQSLGAKLCMLLLLGLPCLIVFPSLMGFAGESAPTKTISASGTVQFTANSSATPELYLSVAHVEPNGSETPVSKLVLQHGAPANGVTQGAHKQLFRFAAQMELWVYWSRNHDAVFEIGKILHGSGHIKRVWQPKNYRLRISSPQPIQCQPAYYDLSQAGSDKPGIVGVLENANFVVTPLSGSVPR